MSSIWSSTGVTPAATDRIPVDVSSSGAPSHWTGQNVADAAGLFGVTVNALGSINTNTTIDWSVGSYVTASIAGSLTFTFSGAPAKGFIGTLVLTDGGSAAVTWPGTVTWAGTTAPTLRSSGIDVLRFYSSDGANWFGELAQDEQNLDAGSITSGALSLARGGTGASLVDPNADRILFWDDSAGAMTWLQLGANLSITDTTISATGGGGLSEPLATPSFTRQSSAPSAASSGEAKLYVRDIARSPLIELLTDVSDPMLVLPSISHPLVQGMWAANATTRNCKGIPTSATGSGTLTGATRNGFSFINAATAATVNAGAAAYDSAAYLVTSGGTLNGYVAWGLFAAPDSSYGTGATGACLAAGVSSDTFPIVAASDRTTTSSRCALFNHNMALSDTNWMFSVRSGASTNITTGDTGLAFSANSMYFWAIHAPDGDSNTYAYIRNLTTGAAGSCVVARQHGSTAAYMGVFVQTLSAVARNIQIQCHFALRGGSL